MVWFYRIIGALVAGFMGGLIVSTIGGQQRQFAQLMILAMSMIAVSSIVTAFREAR